MIKDSLFLPPSQISFVHNGVIFFDNFLQKYFLLAIMKINIENRNIPFIYAVMNANRTKMLTLNLGLVSLINGISTFMGYLMSKPFLMKNSNDII